MSKSHDCNCEACRVQMLEVELDGTRTLLELTTRQLKDTQETLQIVSEELKECLRLVD